MKIRKSLFRSYLLVVILPVLFVVIATGFFAFGQLKQFQMDYGVKQGNYIMLADPAKAMDYVLSSEYERLKTTIEKDKEAFIQKDNLEKYNQTLQKRNAALLLTAGEKVLFDGRDSILAGEEERILSKKYEFTTSQGQISACVLVKLESVLPETRQILLYIIIGSIVAILISGIGLTLWTSAKIMSPIRRLRAATARISQGDLDFNLEVRSQDEFGQLCEDFEEMRKRLKESAEEKVNQDKENKILISNICHDLKTPITSIQGYVEGLMDGVANTPEKQEKYIRTIHNKANEMNTLINELTIYSKLDTNRVPYNFQKLLAVGYFNDCADELKDELEAENVRLSYFNYCNDDVLIIADPEQLSRVIHNIVSNAVKYMNKEIRTISIRVKDVGDFIQVEIEDNAKGIASKDLPYIFERFYRADSSRNETKGSGIGLSIVRKILDDHGGKIWATSKENVGTTMYFVIRKYQEVPNE